MFSRRGQWGGAWIGRRPLSHTLEIEDELPGKNLGNVGSSIVDLTITPPNTLTSV